MRGYVLSHWSELTRAEQELIERAFAVFHRRRFSRPMTSGEILDDYAGHDDLSASRVIALDCPERMEA
jgi:hypothetical protein